MQNLSADIIKTECSDEEKFVLYSADLDDNGKININDATALQQKNDSVKLSYIKLKLVLDK